MRWTASAKRLLTRGALALLLTACVVDDPVVPDVTGPDSVTISTNPLPDGLLGSDYVAELIASGGDGSYAWSIAGGSLPDGLDQQGATISGRPTVGGYFAIDLQATSLGGAATASHRIRVYETEVSQRFLAGLPGLIASSIATNQALLPRNPHLTTEIQAKIALLSDDDLEADVLNDGLFEEARTTTLTGATIPVFIAFPADTMRPGALEDLPRLSGSVAVLEDFLGVQWPHDHVLEWYGFMMGHSGGGGTLFMEDRGTYANRGAPHDVIIPHELGHSYIGHESLTQFLEVYGYNVVETGSTDISVWVWKRGEYVAFSESNNGAWALMDIYQLIGATSMGRAYATIHSLGANYGVHLSSAGRQAFIDEAPTEVRDRVAMIVLRI